MSKKNASFMQTLIARIGQIKMNRIEMNLFNVPHSVAKIMPGTLTALHG